MIGAVMPGFMPGIHVSTLPSKTWMAGTSPAMTLSDWNETRRHAERRIAKAEPVILRRERNEAAN